MALRKTIQGDVRFDEAEGSVGAITPVPGGLGTVTTTVLVSHVAEAAEKAGRPLKLFLTLPGAALITGKF